LLLSWLLRRLLLLRRLRLRRSARLASASRRAARMTDDWLAGLIGLRVRGAGVAGAGRHTRRARAMIIRDGIVREQSEYAEQS